MKEPFGFEGNFVSSYSGWDDNGVMNVSFYDATLCRDIGPLKSGDMVSTIEFDFECTRISIWDKDYNLVFEGNLKIELV